MTSIQSQPPEPDPLKANLSGPDFSAAQAASTQFHDVSFGARLHAAREARGMAIESCAQLLKLPARVLRQLERDEYDGSDSKVYLASYIGKYGRYLGINEASLQVELDRIKRVETTLVATGGISHSRFLFDRYATAATYVVLTAVIVVPMIWLGVRGTLDRDLSHFAPLDSAPVAQLDTASPSSAVNTSSSKLLPIAPPKIEPEQDQPLLASMAPFPSIDSSDNHSADVVAKPEASPVDTGTGTHSFHLTLDASSWVEVIGSDGTRLEYGLLPAGSNKTYRSDKPLDVRIGNATGAQISIDGHSQRLDEFRHANVAHFRVQMQDGKASAASL
ncbi:MAG: RodZ domain-containing protein [Rhodanobacter sp.]